MLNSGGLQTFRNEGSLDRWQLLVDETYGATTNQALSEEKFQGELLGRGLGGLQATRIASTPMRYERATPSSKTDSYFITLTLCEEAYLEQGGRHSIQRSGDIVIYDGAKPYTCSFPAGDDQIVLAVPRQKLLGHLGRSEQLVSRTLSSGAPLGRLAGTMMREVLDTGPLPCNAAERLGESVLEVIANAFEVTFLEQETRPHHHVEQLKRAKRHVLSNLGDATVTLDTVAHAVHISPRTLSRLFAREGETFSRWLWRQRLEQCHALLVNRQCRSVTEVALGAGFANVAHFSRVFRQAYGFPPSRLLFG